MSNTDSFVDEVTEEVRRDKLFQTMRKYGWIAITGVVLIVGGAAYSEWRKAGALADAQARGDAIIEALEVNDPEERAEMLAVQDEGVVAQFLLAGQQVRANNLAEAVATYDAIAANGDLKPIYRDLAALKSTMVPFGNRSEQDRRAMLESLTAPGAPFRLLAMEQLALADVQADNLDEAASRLKAIVEDAAVTPALRQRAQTVLITLGLEEDGE